MIYDLHLPVGRQELGFMKKKHLFIFTLSFLLFICIALTLRLLSLLGKEKQTVDSLTANNQQLEEKIDNLEYDLWLSNNDRAKEISTTETIFPIKGLPMSSSLLSEKITEKTVWEFRGDQINSYKIALNYEGIPILITFWEYQGIEQPSHYVFIGDYGNTIHINSKPESELSYTSQNKAKNRWDIALNQLTTYQDFTTNHSVYVQIKKIEPEPLGITLEEETKLYSRANILNSVKDLKTIADNLFF